MSIIHRFIGDGGAWEWEGVPLHDYGAARPGVSVRRFISRQDGSNNLELRYFELQPGACSNYEKHNYEHAVLILRGSGFVRIADEVHAVKFGDTIFVEADDVHQFVAGEDEPFGFLCTVLDKELRVAVHGPQTLEIYN